MSLNGLVSGCNQKSNRSPVVQLEPDQVEESLDRLREFGAVTLVEGSGRVQKYRHYLYDWLGVSKIELSVMIELLLRGEQTGRRTPRPRLADGPHRRSQRPAGIAQLAQGQGPGHSPLPRKAAARFSPTRSFRSGIWSIKRPNILIKQSRRRMLKTHGEPSRPAAAARPTAQAGGRRTQPQAPAVPAM